MRAVSIKVHRSNGKPAGERVAEVTAPDGRGCLISARVLSDGRLCVEVYRADEGVVVRADPGNLFETV